MAPNFKNGGCVHLSFFNHDSLPNYQCILFQTFLYNIAPCYV